MNKKKLSKLVEKWREQEIITPTQGSKILESTPTAIDKLQKQFPYIFAILGVVLIAAGIFKLIANNWGALAQTWKLVILLASFSLCYYLGFVLKLQRENYPKIGEALIFLGAILFGASLALISQMYHFSENFKNGLLVWSAASLVLAYAIRSKPVIILGLITFAFWLSFENINMVTGILYLGIAYFFIGSLHKATSYTEPFINIIQISGLIIVLFTNFYFNNFGFGMVPTPKFSWLLIIVTLLFALAALAFDLLKQKQPKHLIIYIPFVLLFIYNSPIVKDLLAGNKAMPSIIDRSSNLLFNANNIYFLVLTIALLFAGYIVRKRYIVNLAIVFFILHIVSVYFSFWQMEMSGILFFLIGGILFLSIGFGAEVIRRRLNKEIANA